MLKKVILFFIIAVMLLTTVSFAYEAKDTTLVEEAFSVKVDGNYINAPAHYDYENKFFYLPLRAIFETLGYNVSWNNESRTVNITSNAPKSTEYLTEYKPAEFKNTAATVYPDSAVILIDGEPVVCDMFIYNDRTYISSESLEDYTGHIYLDNTTQTARIYSENYKNLDENTAVVYADGKTLNFTQFSDLVKFVYGDFETGVSEKFFELDNHLVYKGAVEKLSAELGLKVTDEEIKEFLTLNNVEEVLEEIGTEDKKFIKDEILKVYVLLEKITSLDPKNLFTPTEEEIRNYYSTLDESKGIWLKAQHILISKDESGEGLKKTQELLAKLKANPNDFEKLMLEYSEDPGSKAQPEGYVFTQGQMVDSFYNGTLSLKEGEISEIVESEYGYHIIKKIKHWENGVPLEEVKDAVITSYANKVLGEKLHTYMAKEDVFYISDRILEKLATK